MANRTIRFIKHSEKGSTRFYMIDFAQDANQVTSVSNKPSVDFELNLEVLRCEQLSAGQLLNLQTKGVNSSCKEFLKYAILSLDRIEEIAQHQALSLEILHNHVQTITTAHRA